jgi:phosphotransferase system  glucose/maltose/N-acetylglucosamine-specific IIC component
MIPSPRPAPQLTHSRFPALAFIPLYCGIVMAILGCQLDYIWNELQSGIGRLTSDPNLEAGR